MGHEYPLDDAFDRGAASRDDEIAGLKGIIERKTEQIRALQSDNLLMRGALVVVNKHAATAIQMEVIPPSVVANIESVSRFPLRNSATATIGPQPAGSDADGQKGL